uniref:Uncharacterized protein n=1 Tax=Ixodes ricinus TaxID=34613 RepID=A0A6B0V0H2_IXORI
MSECPQSSYLLVTLLLSCILAAAAFFLSICSRFSADMSDDEDAGFPLPPPGDGTFGVVAAAAEPPPLLPLPGRSGATGVGAAGPALTAAPARLERPARGGLRGLGLLKLAASPARPMGLLGPPAEDRAGTFSSERLKGCEVSGGGVSALMGGVSSRGTPNATLEAGLGGLMAIFFMFLVQWAQYQTSRGSLTS